MQRTLVFAALLAVASAFPVTAQDPNADVEALRREVQALRKRLAKADDELLEMARRFDQEKKRLQDEKEALLEENARLKRENALLAAKVGAGKEKDEAKPEDEGLLARRMTLNFPDTPLADVVAFLGDITQANVVLDANIPEGATVTLRVKDLSMKACLDLIAESCRTEDGKACPLKWRLKDGVIQLKKK